MIELFLIPFISSVLVGFYPQKKFACALSVLPLLFLMYNHFQLIGMQVHIPWVPSLSIAFHLRIEDLSVIFLYLTALVIPLSVISVTGNCRSYSLILLLQGLLIGFFTARDLALFTVFWEAMLFPIYFIINRAQVAITFLIYMIAGSCLMVAAVLGLYVSAHTFNIDQLLHTAPVADWMFAVFLLAFAVKTPLFPFHAWLPRTYTEAPTSGSILLAALLSKAGIYGISMIGIGVFSHQMILYGPWLLCFAIAGVFYASFAAFSEGDYKRLIAYSSLAHVNFILAGLFVWSQASHIGAILQSFNHGIIITSLFLVAFFLQERIGTTSMASLGGLAKYFPYLCWLTLFFVLASIATPGTNQFVGELLILFGLFHVHPWLAVILGFSIVFSVVYMLRFMRKVFFQTPCATDLTIPDICAKQFLVTAPLVFLILWIGLYPMPLLNTVTRAVLQLQGETIP